MCHTVTEFSQEAASPWAQRCSLSATKATYCLETACWPATTEIRPIRSGARGCPSVSVSPINHPQKWLRTLLKKCQSIFARLRSVTVFLMLSAEKYEPCRNPGAASTSMQNSEKAFYQAGETLTFSCHPGYELQGEATIYCIPGHPSQWNSTPPACRGESIKYIFLHHDILAHNAQMFLLTKLPFYLCSVLIAVWEWAEAGR